MARLRSPEKRSAILEAAAYEIAESGIGAPTAKIARRAGLAEGTLFTYFVNKDELLNALYLQLKSEIYQHLVADFPHRAGLERRAWHIWSSYCAWAIRFPAKRKAAAQLKVSDLITATTRAATAAESGPIDAALCELEQREAFRGLPPGFASATMGAMHEATLDFIAQRPREREKLIRRSFLLFRRACR
jgi:AcrR family transcriptional regulator